MVNLNDLLSALGPLGVASTGDEVGVGRVAVGVAAIVGDGEDCEVAPGLEHSVMNDEAASTKTKVRRVCILDAGFMRGRLLQAAKSFFQPSKVASNFAWYLIFLALPSVISVIAGAFLHLSLWERLAVGLGVVLLSLAAGILWRERELRATAVEPAAVAGGPHISTSSAPEQARGPVGIYYGSGAHDNLDYGNVIVGFDNPMVDHGTRNKHLLNQMFRGKSSSARASSTKDSKADTKPVPTDLDTTKAEPAQAKRQARNRQRKGR